VDPNQNQDVFPLLVRDIERVCRYFVGYGIIADAHPLAADTRLRRLKFLDHKQQHLIYYNKLEEISIAEGRTI
jgi:serine/threonine-protein kinase RIO1